MKPWNDSNTILPSSQSMTAQVSVISYSKDSSGKPGLDIESEILGRTHCQEQKLAVGGQPDVMEIVHIVKNRIKQE